MIILICLILIIAFLIAFFISDEFAIGSLILSFPFEKTSWYLGFFTLKPTIILIILLYLKIIFKALKVYKIKSKNIKFIFINLISMIIINIISSVMAVNPLKSFSRIIQNLTLYGLLFSFCLLNYNKIKIEKLINYYLLSGIIILAYGYFQIIGYYLGIDTYSLLSKFNNPNFYYGTWVVEINGNVFPRMNSFFGDPSMLCGFLTIICMFILYKIINEKKYVFLLYLLFSVIALGFTFSRSGWIGFIFMLMVYSLFNIKKHIKEISIGILLCLTLIVVMQNSGVIKLDVLLNRMNQTFDSTNISTSGHENFAKLAIQGFKTSPIIGIGLGNFSDFVEEYGMTHSMYLSLICETGILGTLLFFNIIKKLLMDGIKLKSSIQSVVPCVYSIIGFLVSNIAYDYSNQYYFWGVLAMLLYIENMYDKKDCVSQHISVHIKKLDKST
ncbi:O-Antigen ligase [Clostridium ljungdahlii DSM 13528]|uniref:O-Antigen ligase n=1 Tax=Clostridium ljungdahlii (strain ATCC 55383 / DSM 13528 / PETC) TaxID=748727 RepID=A0ABX2TYV5_CLOLD|nr:O-antigen ligase family protein [Clostridium ljungdahlii]OAA89223.1 O-Antigen ligase [Clostridium ljungdahlii DSM 13528]